MNPAFTKLALAALAAAALPAPTSCEPGFDRLGGAYRGAALSTSTSTPPAWRRQMSDIVDAISKDSHPGRKIAGNGCEVVGIPLDKVGASSQEHANDDVGMATQMGPLK